MNVVHLLDRSPLRDDNAVSLPLRSDEELLEGSASCPEQFVTFYDRHAAGLLAFFARRTYDSQMAADLTAETFAQAFAGRARFRNPGPGAATAWLYTIARRQLNRAIRRRRVETQWRERLGMERLEVPAEAIERAEELLDLAQVRDLVADALDALKGDLRQAVVLRVVDGLSYAEAARLAGCSEDLMRQRVSRGLKRLARDLAALRDEPGDAPDGDRRDGGAGGRDGRGRR
jgi:RNA polymerase sigma-70 factor (ECF subfamily)